MATPKLLLNKRLIKRRLAQLKMGVAELARKIGVGESIVYKWLRRRDRLPKADALVSMALALSDDATRIRVHDPDAPETSLLVHGR